MYRQLHRVVGTSVVVGALALSAACGSSSTASSSTTTTSADTPGSTAAQAFLKDYLANPTSIGLQTPLAARPAAGKSVVALKFATGLGTRTDNAQKAAAAALGWSYSSVDAGGTPASAASAFEAAIAKKPDAILFGGFPAALFTKQIAEAKAAGITVLSSGTGDQPVDGVVADLAGAAQQQLFGKLVAAYFVSKAGPQGKVAAFNFQGFPISDLFTNAFVAQVKQWCPTCQTDVVQQQLTDVGTKTPANVVGYLQRKPGVTWTVFASGDLSTGVTPALKTAGLQGIEVLGVVPTAANLAALQSGTEAGWVGYPADVLGWRMIDTLARSFAGTDVASAVTVPLPLQMLTHDNVGSAVTDSGYYTGVKGYQAQFTKLWQVG